MKNFFCGTKDWFFTVMKPFGLMKKNFGNIIAFEVNFRLFTFFVLFPVMTCLESVAYRQQNNGHNMGQSV